MKKKNLMIKRFGVLDRLFHFFLVVTFIIQTLTGFSRIYITTLWGRRLSYIFGGYDASLIVHEWTGVIMTIGFVLHIIHMLTKLNWSNLRKSLFGPDSMLPNFQDLRHFKQQIFWYFGAGPPPRFDRWTYLEKFDYWAVFWGMPLLAITGLMLMFPIASSRFVPGWVLNIAILLHRAEAILAVTYIFIVHFFVGHLLPPHFPFNETIFSGSIPIHAAEEEKPRWLERLKERGLKNAELVNQPPSWVRITYHIFGYTIVATGIYLLINGILYSRAVDLH